MASLADRVLPLIRTRADLHRYSAANAHGADMHHAIDVLEQAMGTESPAEVHAVTHRALSSAIVVVARADDSAGVIGDACRRLLTLHPRTAAAANTPPMKLVDWMVRFQFEGEVDFFELDPVAYAPALGPDGVAAYRRRLADVRARVGPAPVDPLGSAHRREHWVLAWNDQRLAVLDGDVEAVIATHARDRRVARWFYDTALALGEIGRPDLAIDWARRGTEVGPAHQARQCADLWCSLLTDTDAGPHAVAQARRAVFDRWPSSTTATNLHAALSDPTHPCTGWCDVEDVVLEALAERPGDAAAFVLHTLGDPARAWALATDLALDDDRTWAALAEAYQAVDPQATLPVHARLVHADLEHADAARYRSAARRLATMRTLARTVDLGTVEEVDQLVADLRAAHRRRPRLQQEFDRAGLPGLG